MKAPSHVCLIIGVVLCGASAAIAQDSSKEALAVDEPINGVLGTIEGEQIYTQICQGCHMTGGRGAIGAGYYPAFTDNPTLASANYMAATVLNGRRNMPSFAHHEANEFFFPATWLSDTQIANVVNYIRSHFGNQYTDTISAADVTALHAKEPGE